MLNHRSYISLSALIASDPALAEFARCCETITGRTPQLAILDEVPILMDERLANDLKTLEDRIMDTMKVEAEPVSQHPKRKSYQSPYGPQRGRKQ